MPPDKPGAEWDPSEGVFFIWGDTDFDSYGPRSPPTQMHDYIFNQIVPQLSLGSGLASSDPVTFKPKFIQQSQWMIQALACIAPPIQPFIPLEHPPRHDENTHVQPVSSHFLTAMGNNSF